MTTLTFTEKVSREETICADSNYDANWYYKIKTIPGTYVARCVTLQGKPCSLEDAYWVLVSVDAICVDGYIPGYKGKNMAEESFGKPMPSRAQIYGYAVIASMKEADSPWAVQATVSA